MKKSILIFCVIALPICAFSQKSPHQQPSIAAEKQQSSQSFEKYCLKNATSLIENAGDKTVKISGTLPKLKSKNTPTYKEFGIALKENETQYFKIEGSEKILAVKSLFVLRLNHKNSKK
jgi:hypothetical protein